MKKYIIISVVLTILIYLFKSKIMKLSFFDTNVIRKPDAGGSGAFGANRKGHTHQGIDIVAKPKQVVKAPFDMEFTRVSFPYADDKRYLGGVYKFSDPILKGELKVFYMSPTNKSKNIKKGDVIGEVQDIAAKYGTKGMVNHIHVEMRDIKGTLINPTQYV